MNDRVRLEVLRVLVKAISEAEWNDDKAEATADEIIKIIDRDIAEQKKLTETTGINWFE